MTQVDAATIAAQEAVEALFNEEPTDDLLEAVGRGLGAAIRSRTCVEALEQLLQSYPITDLFSMADPSLPFWPEVADAMVDLARGLGDPDEAERAMGWAIWGGSQLPTDLVRDPSLARSRRAPFADALEKHAPIFRQWLEDASPPRR